MSISPKPAPKPKKHAPTFITPKYDNTTCDEQIALILQTHRNHCNHQERTSQKPPYVCDALIKIILNAIDKDQQIQNTSLHTFFGLVTYSKNYYNKSNCIRYNKKNIVDLTNKLFAHQIPSLDLLKTLVANYDLDNCFVSIITNEKFSEVSSEYMDFLLVELSQKKYGNRYNKLHKTLIERLPVNQANLIRLCESSNMILTQNVADLISKSDKQYVDDMFNGINIMKIACKNLPNSTNVVTALLNKSYTITTDEFSLICAYCLFNHIKYILELSRMVITSNHFEAIINAKAIPGKYVESGSEEEEEEETLSVSEEEYNSKGKKCTTRSDAKIDRKLENKLTKLELLFHNGYIPTRDDIKKTITKHIEIPNIERFDIVFDEEMLELCRTSDFYPKYKFTCITPEMLELQKACHTKNFPLAKTLIKTHNLVPDAICMEAIAKYKENKVLEILIKAGGKVNLECVKQRAECYANNKFMLAMIHAYEQEHEKEINQYKSKILELETFVKDNVPEELRKPKYNIIDLDIKVDKLNEYKQKYKNKRVPHKKIVEFFGPDKIPKINYIDFQTLLIDKMKMESWKYNNNEQLICVPLKYRTLFGLDDNINNVVSINDLDKLVCSFYITL